MRKNNRGISLLEVITVIGIIIVLIGLIMPAISIVRNNGKETEASAEMAQLDTALMAYFSDKGCFPGSGRLLSLRNTYFNFDSKRIEGNDYNDRWGREYLYLRPGIISSKGYDLFSLGLLESQGNSGTFGKIINALYASVTSSVNGNVSNTPPGLGGITIWGLPKPQYDMLIMGALSLLRSTDIGFNLAVMINISNLPIIWDDPLNPMLSPGVLAAYFPTSHIMVINPIFKLGPAEAITSEIAHEATHLADHLATGDTDFDSIEEEYDAKYSQTMVWKELTEEKTFTNLNDPEFVEKHPSYVGIIESQNEELAMIMKGEEEAKEELRKRYPNLPEEDQYGDSYVVAKEY